MWSQQAFYGSVKSSSQFGDSENESSCILQQCLYGLRVKIRPGSRLVFGVFHEVSRHQPQIGVWIWEDPNDIGPASNLLVQPF